VLADDSVLEAETDDVLSKVAALALLVANELVVLTLAFGMRWTMICT